MIARASQLFLPTLRDDPADAEAVSHKLLVRGGFIRQVSAGLWTFMPLGWRVHRKIEQIIREEMDAIGGQEMLMPVLTPVELWEATGRAGIPEIFHIQDRTGRRFILPVTHEETATFHAREIQSYKQLPQLWYHFQTKDRDEPRPRGGLLRVREFIMKDAYSFDRDEEGFVRSFEANREAYERMFERCGLRDLLRAGRERDHGRAAQLRLPRARPGRARTRSSCARTVTTRPISRSRGRSPGCRAAGATDAPEEIETPDVTTIEGLAEFLGIDASATSKAMARPRSGATAASTSTRPGIGIASLRQAIVEHQERFYGLRFDPDSEVLVTAGPPRRSPSSLLALLGPGDEVIVFEPWYDSYAACIAMAGAGRRTIMLRAPTTASTPPSSRVRDQPRPGSSCSTSPHNPTGKVFTRAELDTIAAVAIEHDLAGRHRRGLRAPRVRRARTSRSPRCRAWRERTVTISRRGKTFSVTGWKIGWVCAPAALVDRGPHGEAVPHLRERRTVPAGDRRRPRACPTLTSRALTADMRDKRDLLCEGLSDAGFHGATARRARTSSRSTSARSASTTAWRSAGRCPIDAVWWRVPSVVFYDDKAGRDPGALRVLQAS